MKPPASRSLRYCREFEPIDWVSHNRKFHRKFRLFKSKVLPHGEVFCKQNSSIQEHHVVNQMTMLRKTFSLERHQFYKPSFQILKSPASRCPLNPRGANVSRWSFTQATLPWYLLIWDSPLMCCEVSCKQESSTLQSIWSLSVRTFSEEQIQLINPASPNHSLTAVEVPCKQRSSHREWTGCHQMKLHLQENFSLLVLLLESPLMHHKGSCKQEPSVLQSIKDQLLQTASEEIIRWADPDSWNSPLSSNVVSCKQKIPLKKRRFSQMRQVLLERKLNPYRLCALLAPHHLDALLSLAYGFTSYTGDFAVSFA